ncbi:hypothetical protein LJC36_05730 [Desulfovibrio sp. OttesenSCG-928-C14]|nr:hypothetical protein [Desulfovibrio sp. OttesenSCG-928-C14]
MLNLTGKTQGAVISCNVSYKNGINAATLVDILAGRAPLESRWLPHIDTFFNELPKDSILGLMSENSLTPDDLAAVFYSLPSVIQGNNFKALLDEIK